MSEARLWQGKRREVISSGPPGCWLCGDTAGPVHIHHRYYEAGRARWDYPAESMSSLCATCHAVADQQRRRLCRAHGALRAATAEMALGYMFGIRAIWDQCDDPLIGPEISGAEFVDGVAQAFEIPDDAVWAAIGKRDGVLDPIDLAKLSRMRACDALAGRRPEQA